MSRGYIALTTILIVAAVVLAITANISFLAIGESQASLSLTKGESSLAFIEACVEDALIKLRADGNYNGGNITRPEGTCAVSLSSKVGNTYTFNVSSTGTDYNHTIRVVVNRTGTGLTLTSWQQI